MADERIDIEVTDKVAGSVETKLRGIGNAAKSSHDYVKRLKSELASINTTALSKVAAASRTNASSALQEAKALAMASQARDRSAIADAKAATEKQRLATETARTMAAEAKAEAAASRAASAQLRAAQAAQRAASAKGDLASRANTLKASLNPLAGAQDRFNAEMNEARTLLQAGAINMRTYTQAVSDANAKLNTAKVAQDRFNIGTAKGGKTAGLAGHQMANLSAQFQDVAISLEGGQDPMRVFLQQGSQIQYIASTVEGGFKTLALETAKMTLRFLPLIVAGAGVVALLDQFTTKINDAADTDAFVKSLNLTEDELKELGETSVTMGDTIKGVLMTIEEALNLTDALGSLKDMFVSAFGFIWDVLKNFTFGLVALMKGTFDNIIYLWNNFGPIMGDIFVTAANLAIAAIEGLVNGAINGLNSFIQGANGILGAVGIEFDQFSTVTIGRFSNANAGAAAQLGQNYMDAFKDAETGYNRFVDRVGQNAITARNERLTGRANELKEDRSGSSRSSRDKAAEAAEKRADALGAVNLQLDNELDRMRELKDEREVLNRLDRITEQLARKKISLNQEELASIEAKVRAIQEYSYVQAELDRITENAIEPQRTYNASVEAATDLLARGVITQRQYNEEVGGAKRELEDALDPLSSYRRELAEQEATLGLYGNALEDAVYQQRIMNELAAQYGGAAEEYRAEAMALTERNRAMQNALYVQNTLAGLMSDTLARDQFLTNMGAMYSEIERLRQQDIVSEEEAQRLKFAIQSRYQDLRLGSYSDFFGELAGLASSGNAELAAIGKAAAVAQATIDGFLAVQKALASAPPPLNFALAGAVALKTGAQVAGIMSTNVGSFNTGGQFMVNGQGGVDQNNINMNVSRGERVTIETPQQQRANDGSGGGVDQSVKIINVTDPQEAIAAMDSDDGERVIMNAIRRNPSAVAAAVQRANT